MLFKHYSKWIDGADAGREKSKLNGVFGPKLDQKVSILPGISQPFGVLGSTKVLKNWEKRAGDPYGTRRNSRGFTGGCTGREVAETRGLDALQNRSFPHFSHDFSHGLAGAEVWPWDGAAIPICERQRRCSPEAVIAMSPNRQHGMRTEGTFRPIRFWQATRG